MYNINYIKFLEELIDTAIDSGDLYFITGDWCKEYCRITRKDYKFVVKRAFDVYRNQENV